MSNESYQITKLEMTVVLMSMLIGVGSLTIGSDLAKVVGSADGWISILISATVHMILVYFIVKLHRYFPGKTFIQYTLQGKKTYLLGKVLGMVFILYFLLFLAYEVRILTFVVRMYLLDRTPSEVTAMLIFFTSTYAVTKGVQGIVHLNILFFPIVFGTLSFIVVFNLNEAEFTNLLPVAAVGIGPIFNGALKTIFPFLGIKILFFFLAYMKKEDLQATPLNIGIFILTALYLGITILSFAILSVPSTKLITFPTVALAKEVEIIKGLIERLEPIMITVWIMTIFNTISISHFLIVKIVKDEFLPKYRMSTLAIWVAFVAFFVIFYPNSIQETFQFGDFVSYFGFSLSIGACLIGYAIVYVRTRKKQSRSEGM